MLRASQHLISSSSSITSTGYYYLTTLDHIQFTLEPRHRHSNKHHHYTHTIHSPLTLPIVLESTSRLQQTGQTHPSCPVKAQENPSCKPSRPARPISCSTSVQPLCTYPRIKRLTHAKLVVVDSPTRMNLTLTKQRLKGAQTGHSLLAKKRDALMTRFRAILRKVDEVSLPRRPGSVVV